MAAFSSLYSLSVAAFSSLYSLSAAAFSSLCDLKVKAFSSLYSLNMEAISTFCSFSKAMNRFLLRSNSSASICGLTEKVSIASATD